ncbi:RNA polymerase sigma factor [Domibacillus enclensis]|uniref:RNA polymerase sigma factor n=1 Tax=Domibacillus enclensis TaxID=1017273 RepID=A0A1N6S2M0_9BACI|nr:sigma-70 family RNA polymerase sigma factor [Domibacillus enclensis]OXS79202.1 RNA polymerase subunit sigma-70 [Domibacillus enclensis]SIQ35290.1 RNA polymerase sigma-70 factor, ECF subfamily [Domibacillus enclensis]
MSEQDFELYERIQAADKQALETLYERYEKLLFSFALRMTGRRDLSEEIVQDVFMKIWTKPNLYDRSKGKFSSWLLTVTRNASIDSMRRKNEQTEALDERDSLKSNEPAVEDLVQWKEEGTVLRHAIAQLAEEQREMIELFYFKGLSQRAIAEERNIPLGTVKGRIRLALKHLKGHLSTGKGGVDGEVRGID